MKRKLKFAHLIGDGIGKDFANALEILLKAFENIDFEVVKIEEFRLPNGDFDPNVAKLIGEIGVAMKGPTRTTEGPGPKSANVLLRQLLGLYQNVRPVKWFPGIITPVIRPELLDVVIFRQNTEDIYMGIEKPAGSKEMRKLINFLKLDWGISPSQLPEDGEIGGGIKLISKNATEKIVRAAIEYAIKNGRNKVAIVHKGNIMKETEGAFKNWALKYAKDNYPDLVYFKEDQFNLSEEEKAGKILIDTIITDDCLSQLLINPKRFSVIVTMNLNGDYLSDAAAAQVGGVPTAAGANIGDNCIVGEAIGGTADDIAGQDKANPTAFLLAFALVLGHQGLSTEANAIRQAIGDLFKKQIGTADMKFTTKLSTSAFTALVAEGVKNLLEE